MKPISFNPEWTIESSSVKTSPEDIEGNGAKFLIANGYIGLRGTLEEHGAAQLSALTINGLYDQQPGKWREPVNAPHPFFLQLSANGIPLTLENTEPLSHRQLLDLRTATHHRFSVYKLPGGAIVNLHTERFLSIENPALAHLRTSFSSDQAIQFKLLTGINSDTWDINGPHLEKHQSSFTPNTLTLSSRSIEEKIPLIVEETHAADFGDDLDKSETISPDERSILRRYIITGKANKTYSLTKTISINSPLCQAPAVLSGDSYEEYYFRHAQLWKLRWQNSNVQISGDPEAQLALRYSIYHLLILSPTHSDAASIPARGLSGQVYKGAVFWDTEIFMLPFYGHTQPDIARTLLRYRHKTLPGARRKAQDLGFRGAFYAWESQETGDDACSYFNVTDIHTGRPLRTYFRDKQVHISADIAYAVWEYYRQSSDLDFLISGGAEIILECARFFLSYAIYNPDRRQYEIRDVIGPDEYHERVDNNAYTNVLVAHILRAAHETLEMLREKSPGDHMRLIHNLDYAADAARLLETAEKLFIPQPDPANGVIEQFHHYHRLEDTTLETIKKRLLHPNEYWGATHGPAANTKIIKQADVILMLHLFRDRYSEEIRKANWEYYEPRTEHGSSLSACAYALVATHIGKDDYAYRYFLKTATIDLTGKSKQYIGPLYIGGTHPAANGGAWMSVIQGFAGLSLSESSIRFAPKLPQNWDSLSYRFCHQGNWFTATHSQGRITLLSDEGNNSSSRIAAGSRQYTLNAGETLEISADE